MRFFEIDSDPSPVDHLSVFKVKALCEKMINGLADFSTVQVDIDALVRGYVRCPLRDIQVYLDIAASFYLATVSFAYLRRCVAKEEQVVAGNVVKQSVKVAIKQLNQAMVTVTRAISYFELAIPQEGMELEISDRHGKINQWLNNTYSCLPAMSAQILVQCLEANKALSDQVKAHTPEWEHLITDDTYQRAACKVKIIGWEFGDRLAEEIPLMYKVIFDLTQLAAAWGCKEELASLGVWTVGMAEASNRYTQGKRYLTIRVACVCVQVKTGQAAVDQAKLLSPVKATMPQSLQKALDQVIHMRGGGSAAPVKRKATDAVDVGASIVPVTPRVIRAKPKSMGSRKS